MTQVSPDLLRDTDSGAFGLFKLLNNTIAAFVGGIQMLTFKTYNGAAQAVCLNAALADNATVYDNTTAAGGTVNIPQGTSTYMLEPGSTLATLTVNLPPNPADGQQCVIATYNVVTALTMGVQTASATIVGAATAAAANASYGYQYRATSNKWYRLW